ncbi:MAG TPA: OsmC family protein [Bacteroidales bacterium]|nr:OsmC family protein [Bacteroidales bacterium]HSA42895.1 OsmC family protein [Bacteroidales bacterium]
MKHLHVSYKGALKTRITHILSGTEIMTDAPPDNEGEGAYLSPTDMLASAFASCMLTIMGIYARRNNIPIDGTSASVIKIMASEPRRIGEIILDIHFPPYPYTDKDKKIFDQITRTCPVSQSLHPDISRKVTLHYAPLQ